MSRQYWCIICDRPAVGATRALTGYRQPLCRPCSELARCLVLPRMDHQRAARGPYGA
jgi:hypothetical protein